MTNHWIDLRNADRIMIIGANAAENHPISFKWVTAAMERGAKLISVDPRFTRTSSKADIYAPLRSGTDITFVGGMIRYILNDMQTLTPAQRAEKYNIEYLTQYTNAALIVNSGFESTDNDLHPGLFSGFTASTAKPGKVGNYNKSTWNYANATNPDVDSRVLNNTWTSWDELDNFCVLKLLWEHFSRYTPDMVSNITGCPQDKFLEVCAAYSESGVKDKAGTIMYAMGTTQHTYGTQNIRAYSILQILLGNMGIAGGGINAMRGTSNVQGSTDMALLSHLLPGYLAVPVHTDQTLNDYLNRSKGARSRVRPQGLAGDNSLSWWWNTDEDDVMKSNYSKYIVSLLAAWYGEEAQSDANACFNRLPKVTSGVDCTHIGTFEALAADKIKGMMVWGQNPANGGPNSNGARKAMENLDWLMVAELFHSETSEFWKRPGATSSSIKTEVFLLPAAASYEKQGSISNSGRWAQWRYKAVNPIGEAKDDLAIMDTLMLKLKELYEADSDAPNREAITQLVWDYHTSGDYAHEPDPNAVAKELGGYELATGKTVTSFVNLKSDGSTVCGNWLYCGMMDADGNNKAKNRGPVDASLNQIGLYSGWAWCWPVNRRIIYNRASVDLDGKPFDAEHPVVAWNDAWQGDVIDGGGNPINLAAAGSKNLPFIMNREGVARLWGTTLNDGPLPEAYEPWESPLSQNIMTGVAESDPTGMGKPGFIDPSCYVGELNGMNARGTVSEYPCVGTTYRVAEHWQAGQMTRNHPWLNEVQPEVFAEIGPELAADRGISNGDKVRVSTARGHVDAVAVVTNRMHRMTIGGKSVDHVGVPWHWGYVGLSSADASSGNILTPHVGDANTTIPEYKTFLCDITKV